MGKFIRIKKDVFKNATFGKLYKTRGGDKAVFLTEKYDGIKGCILLIERDLWFEEIEVSDKGKHYPDKDLDIVSEWDENI